MSIDTNAIRAEWLVICGNHDAMQPMGCSCPSGDPRTTIADLLDEVERLTTDRHELLNSYDRAMVEVYQLRTEVERITSIGNHLMAERDAAYARAIGLAKDRDEARATAERLQTSLDAVARLTAARLDREEPQDEPDACGDVLDMGVFTGTCHLDAGHDGHHSDGNGGWSDAVVEPEVADTPPRCAMCDDCGCRHCPATTP